MDVGPEEQPPNPTSTEMQWGMGRNPRRPACYLFNYHDPLVFIRFLIHIYMQILRLRLVVYIRTLASCYLSYTEDRQLFQTKVKSHWTCYEF